MCSAGSPASRWRSSAFPPKPTTLAAEWPYYLAYNLFRVAAILQGIAKRVEDGTASSARARESAAAARPLAELGWQYALRHG